MPWNHIDKRENVRNRAILNVKAYTIWSTCKSFIEIEQKGKQGRENYIALVGCCNCEVGHLLQWRNIHYAAYTLNSNRFHNGSGEYKCRNQCSQLVTMLFPICWYQFIEQVMFPKELRRTANKRIVWKTSRGEDNSQFNVQNRKENTKEETCGNETI